MDPYVEVCRIGGVNVRQGRVVVGPCLRQVRVVYSLTGVTPISTVSPIDGQIFFVPRVNTFRPDGQFLVFFNQAGTYTERIRIFPCDPTTNRYGVDVFNFTPQVVNVTSTPVVPVVMTSEQNGTQQKRQLIFTTDATVFVNVSTNPNSRFVTFSVDMSVPMASGAHKPEDYVEVRGSFNNFAGSEFFRLTRDGNIYRGALLIVGNAGSSIQWKFFSGRLGFESGANRGLQLGPIGVAQTTTPATLTWRN